MHILRETSCKINIVGINDHELTALPIATTSMVLQPNQGPVVGIVHEYVHLRQGSSIHASGQLEWFHTHVNELSKIVGGQQQLVTLERYTVHILIDSGLTYSHPVCVPSNHDLQTLPHVVFTSPQEWDPTILDNRINLELLPAPHSAPDQSLLEECTFDEFGELT